MLQYDEVSIHFEFLHFLPYFLYHLTLNFLLGVKLDRATELNTPSTTEFQVCPTQADAVHSPVIGEWIKNPFHQKNIWEEEKE